MDPYIGEIRLVAFNFVPPGWAACNGESLPIEQNAALFTLLGTAYGGNGSTTFSLPNLPGPASQVGGKPGGITHYLIAVNGIFPPRS